MSELEEKKVQAQQPASAAKPAATRPAAPSAVAAPAAPAENEIHPRTVTIDEFHREMERLKDEEKMDMLELITGVKIRSFRQFLICGKLPIYMNAKCSISMVSSS